MSRLAFAFWLCASVDARGQDLARYLNAVVGVTVGRGADRAAQQGTGFVVSADSASVSILTAKHLFFVRRRKEPFTSEIGVVFYFDQQHSYRATLAATSGNETDVAIIKVENLSLAVIRQLPAFSVRLDSQPLSLAETLHTFGGKSWDWQLATNTVSDTGAGKIAEQFQFTGVAVDDGFSGAPVLDAHGLLVGVHLGKAETGEAFARAVRITKAYQVLNGQLGVPMNKLNFSGSPSAPKGGSPQGAAPPGDPNARAVMSALSQAGTMERTANRLGLRSDLKIQNQRDTLMWYQSAKALAVNAHAFDQIAGHESPMLVARIGSVAGRRMRADEVTLKHLKPVLSFDIELLSGQLDFEPKPGTYVAFRGTPATYLVPNAGSVVCRLSVLPAHFLEVESPF